MSPIENQFGHNIYTGQTRTKHIFKREWSEIRCKGWLNPLKCWIIDERGIIENESVRLASGEQSILQKLHSGQNEMYGS